MPSKNTKRIQRAQEANAREHMTSWQVAREIKTNRDQEKLLQACGVATQLRGYNCNRDPYSGGRPTDTKKCRMVTRTETTEGPMGHSVTTKTLIEKRKAFKPCVINAGKDRPSQKEGSLHFDVDGILDAVTKRRLGKS